MPNPAYAAPPAETEPDEFGAWLVVREITDGPTHALAAQMAARSDRPVGEVRDWQRRGLVFALTDPAAPPAENIAATAVFVPIGADTLELAAMAVADDHGGRRLVDRLLEPVTHILAARGVTRIVVRHVPAGPDGAALFGGLDAHGVLVL